MAYDEAQAERLRRALAGRRAVTEKRMFGGLCFMLRDHMLCGIGWEGLMFRVGEAREAVALARPGATLMEIGERKMRGFIWVDPAACGARELTRWVALAEDYVASLPPKKSKKTRTTGKVKAAGGKLPAARSARRSRNPPAG
jgi:hypothetical protein